MMSCDQRQKHLKKVLDKSCTPFEDSIASYAASSSSYVSSANTKHLSIPPEKCGISTISAELLECTWRKAEKLLNTTGSICKAPGMTNAMCVASDTGGRPHIVSRSKKGDLICDNECLAWKSKKLCSHVLAVAEEWKCLDEFLSWHKRMKISGNYTAMYTHDLPRNVGQKPKSSKGPISVQKVRC